MKYLLLIYNNPTTWATPPGDNPNEGWRAHLELNADLRETGELVESHPLQTPDTTRTVTVRDGKTLATDGPYAEAKEYLAGYYLVDCENIDRALEIAARIPDAAIRAVEVRPVMNLDGAEF